MDNNTLTGSIPGSLSGLNQLQHLVRDRCASGSLLAGRVMCPFHTVFVFMDGDVL